MVHMRKKRRRKFRMRRNIQLIVSICVVLFFVSSIFVIRNQQIRRQEETPIESNLVRNTYDYSKLQRNGSFLSYEDDTYTSMQGIDVSSHQEYIDWQKVKNAGIEFAYIRVGYRGYETGEIHKDIYFEYNIQSAKKYGIQVGVYFFSQAINVEEAREEAEFTLNAIQDYEIDLPVSYDIEEAGEGSGRVDQLSKEVWTQNAVTFLHVIGNAGYQTMNYNSAELLDMYFNLEYMQEFETWVAHYDTDSPSYPYTFLIWQYTSNGKVDGIDGGTDMDIMFVKKN